MSKISKEGVKKGGIRALNSLCSMFERFQHLKGLYVQNVGSLSDIAYFSPTVLAHAKNNILGIQITNTMNEFEGRYACVARCGMIHCNI